MIRVPVIVPNSNWSPRVAAATAAQIISPILIQAKPGKLTITGTVLPTDTQTVIFSTPFAQTYTFKTTPTLQYDVQIAGTIAGSVANLISKIQENETTVNVWVEGSNGIIEHKTAGDGNNVATPTGTWVGVTYTQTPAHNGAYPYNGQNIQVYDGAILYVGNIVTTTAHNAANLATAVHTALGSPASIGVSAVSNRLILTSTAIGATAVLEIDPASASTLFTPGHFAVGASTGNPVSDIAGTDRVVRLYHPADPVFFRNDNRPLIDLADNDRFLHKNFVALKDGYDIDTGTTYSSSSPESTITAPNGITINGPLFLKGGIFFNGSGAVNMNVTTLNVSDRVITANSGEAGSGVGGGSGVEAGLKVDRGLWNDTGVLWYEKSSSGNPNDDSNALVTDQTVPFSGGYWQIDGPVIGTAYSGKALIVGRTDGISSKVGTVVEYEQITIGDGTATIGSLNASGGVIDTALANAIALLPSSGGKIFIKRGTYTVSSNIIISKNNVTIEGEGAATVLSFGNTFRIRVGTIATPIVSNAMFHKIRFAHSVIGNVDPMLQLLYGTQLSTSTALTNLVSYRVDAFTVGDNFTNVGFPATPVIGNIYTATASLAPTLWTSTTTKITPVYSRGCIVEKCWFDGVSGSITNLDVDFNEYHGHMLSNNISTTYYTNLP